MDIISISATKNNIENYTKDKHISASVVMPGKPSYHGGDCTVYGWGRTDGTIKTSNSPYLKSTKVDIYSHAKCTSLEIPYRFIYENSGFCVDRWTCSTGLLAGQRFYIFILIS